MFWFTTFIAIYFAALTQIGLELAFVCPFLGFGLMMIVSWVLRGSKYDDDAELGWDVLITCFAFPCVLFLIFATLSNAALTIFDSLIST